MSVTFVQGDMFQSGCQTLVNPTNTQGVMGAGLARAFKMKYPDVYALYARDCSAELIQPGSIRLYRRGYNPQVLCFFTKDHWKDPSKLTWVVSGMDELARTWQRLNIASIAIPPLGCGLGGLQWTEVRRIVEEFGEKMPIPVKVYEPFRFRR